jgi:hypothetical protein
MITGMEWALIGIVVIAVVVIFAALGFRRAVRGRTPTDRRD